MQMTEQQRQDHISMFRKRAFMWMRKHVITPLSDTVEWHTVKRKSGFWGHVVGWSIIGIMVWFILTKTEPWVAAVTLTILLGILIFNFRTVAKQPELETILVYDKAAGVLRASEARLEIDGRHITKLATRRVKWDRAATWNDPLDVRIASGRRHHDDRDQSWWCVYAFVGEDPCLLFAEPDNHTSWSGLHGAVEKLAQALDLPLLEPPNGIATCFK